MTIPEAVQLIIRAGSLSEASGEVFVLEMGEPVRIIDLAETMIRLSGLEPERDIAIEIVGARPGEKLHEDLFNPYERLQPTPAQKILRAAREPLDPAWVERIFGEINLLVLEGDAAVLAAARLQAGRRSSRAPRPIPTPGSPRRLTEHMGPFPLHSPCTTSSRSVGADAGFAAIIGLAILVLLYFAQARETANLRCAISRTRRRSASSSLRQGSPPSPTTSRPCRPKILSPGGRSPRARLRRRSRPRAWRACTFRRRRPPESGLRRSRRRPA